MQTKWHVHARVCLQTIPFRTPACKLTRITLGLCSLLVWAGKYLGSINTQGCGTREAQEFNYTPWQSLGSAVISVLLKIKQDSTQSRTSHEAHTPLAQYTQSYCCFPEGDYFKDDSLSPHTVQGLALLYSRHLILPFTHLCSASNE